MKLSDEELIHELQLRLSEKQPSLKEMNDLMAQLQQLNKKLEQSETMKSNFLSNIRNEIINPFTAILGLSESILKSSGEDMDKVKTMASLIHLEAFGLDFQLRNIFAAAELEAGEGHPQIITTEITNLLKGAIDSFKEMANRKILVIEFSSSPSEIKFNTDPLKFQLIISNLLSNAIEFSYPDSKINIYAGLQSEGLVIKVTDYGIGIKAVDVPKIFDRFQQLESGMTKSHKGHGLGLAVAQALAENLKGTLSVSSGKQGSTFILFLPLSEEWNNSNYSEEGNDTFFINEEKF
ncbi:histidine kinase [Sporocytophaga myxococcoides]|uniref:histidine kinase n=1 Tax=Sporocytophaga myxococcoides TaxID=153721 RepID=A0A098LKY5_9BACT|nr:HAMP domain-containing sensor histidine kinase [Sporocytophaga myxococcoides]GAL87661.1 histidine kinase [Sporocytophaga myxococcoides]